jgi:hypothetical protein
MFTDILGVPAARACRINLDCLDISRLDLSSLCVRFTEDDIWSVIHSLPRDKAPRPDGFTDRFL